jgi:FAD/FMN-containing dehydrogenase
VLRYGNTRELCLGLEVVTAEGESGTGLSGLRKDNTGYDLRDLFIGSEGTLGIITGATLKLYPLPVARMTALAACHAGSGRGAAGPGAAARWCRADRLRGDGRVRAQPGRRHFPQLPRALAAVALDRAAGELGFQESEAHARAFERCWKARSRRLRDPTRWWPSLAQSHALWHMRESIPLAQAEEGLNIKHDIAFRCRASRPSWPRPMPR